MLRRTNPPPDEEDNSAFWLITYSDMTTLLLAFFLLIYSFTVMGEEKTHTLLESLNIVQKGGDKTDIEQPIENIEETAREIAALIGEDAEGAKPWVDATEAEITLGLPASITFASGSAELTRQGQKVLSQVVRGLAKLDRPVRVEGHTDNVPIHTALFPSNWHLSSARAQRVVKLFINAGMDPRLLQVVGYADTRPRQDNDTVEGRAANRRIEIKIVRVEEHSTDAPGASSTAQHSQSPAEPTRAPPSRQNAQ